MTARATAENEPAAGATPQERRRFLTLAGLFLAGPVIWINHFMAVYLLGEALCAAGTDQRLLGLHVLSTVTLVATAVATVAASLTTWWSYRRWQAAGGGWDGTAHGEQPSAEVDQEGRLALAGFLLGVLFTVAILFVGIPAAFLAC